MMEILSENIVIIVCVCTVLVSLVISLKNSDKWKKVVENQCKFKQREYDALCEADEFAIVNSTLTFDGSSCEAEESFDALYAVAIKNGCQIVFREKFLIPSLDME